MPPIIHAGTKPSVVKVSENLVFLNKLIPRFYVNENCYQNKNEYRKKPNYCNSAKVHFEKLTGSLPILFASFETDLSKNHAIPV